jgi:AcrR family transcriptional regulator
MRMDTNLGREDWLHAARLALLRGGVEQVRVEKLARALKVTKGSFYWHFKDREELLELLLREWEDEVHGLLIQLGKRPRREKLDIFLRLLEERVRLSEDGKTPSDAAIFAWASVDPEVARRVNKAEQTRIRQLQHLVDGRNRMELFYLVWIGFVARGQRVPESRKRFPVIARLLLESVDGHVGESRRQRRGSPTGRRRAARPALKRQAE